MEWLLVAGCWWPLLSCWWLVFGSWLLVATSSCRRFSAFPSTSDCRVFSNAAVPDEACQQITRDYPTGLHDQPLVKLRAAHPTQIHVDRKEHLVRKGGELQRAERRRRQNIQREQVPARNVFESEHDENEGRHFHHPEGEQGHRITDEELQQTRKDQGKPKPSQ